MKSVILWLIDWLKGLPRWHLANMVALGFVVALFNLKDFLSTAAQRWSPSPELARAVHAVTGAVEQLLTGFTGDQPTFTDRIAQWLVTGFWWYFAATLLAAALLRKPRNGVYGAGGLVVGLAWFPVACWALLVTWKVGAFFVSVVAWVTNLFAPVAEFLARIFAFVAPWIFGGAVVVLAALGVAGLVAKLRGRWLAIVGWSVAAAGVSLLLAVRFWSFVTTFVVPALAAVGAVLLVAGLVVLAVAGLLIAAGLLIGSLGLLGWLTAEQFTSAWEGGRGPSSMAISGFAVGTAAAMLLMVCIGCTEAGRQLDAAWSDHSWFARDLAPAATFAAALPESVAGWLGTALRDASAPVFDGVLMLGLFACAPLGMFHRADEPAQTLESEFKEYLEDGKRFAGILGSAVAAPVLVYFWAQSSSDG